MPRPKKAPIFGATYNDVETRYQDILKGMPLDRDLTDAETAQLLRGTRKGSLAYLIATSEASPDPDERKWAREQLMAQDMGKAGTRKKSDGDDVGAVMLKPGENGIPPMPCPHCGKMIGI